MARSPRPAEEGAAVRESLDYLEFTARVLTNPSLWEEICRLAQEVQVRSTAAEATLRPFVSVILVLAGHAPTRADELSHLVEYLAENSGTDYELAYRRSTVTARGLAAHPVSFYPSVGAELLLNRLMRQLEPVLLKLGTANLRAISPSFA